MPPNGNDGIEILMIALRSGIEAQNVALQKIAICLQSIEAALRDIAVASNPAPNYRRSLSEYPTFDWSSIGATVIREDADGPAVVEWNGQQFVRRSADNRFDAALWFSRSIGKDADGNNKYARLITFKPAGAAEPIAAKAKKAIRAY